MTCEGAGRQRQLQMMWPERLLDRPPRPELPEGYELRCYEDADESQYLQLMAKAGFDDWDHDRLEKERCSVLPDGFFLIVHRATGRAVATALTQHGPSELHPCGGQLGWVAGDPEHKGKRLGLAICAAVVGRCIEAGYRRIYVKTDDWRLPAIKTYLKLGFEPFVFREGMAERWQKVRETLGWPLSPDASQ